MRELDSISQQPSHSNLKNLKSKNSNFPQRLIEDFNKKGKVALSDFMIKYNQESTEAPYKSKDPAKLDSYGSAHQRVQSYTYHHYLRAQLLDLLATFSSLQNFSGFFRAEYNLKYDLLKVCEKKAFIKGTPTFQHT